MPLQWADDEEQFINANESFLRAWANRYRTHRANAEKTYSLLVEILRSEHQRHIHEGNGRMADADLTNPRWLRIQLKRKLDKLNLEKRGK